MGTSKDSRWVYGAHCTWHASIDKVGIVTSQMKVGPPRGQPANVEMALPCCPNCRGMLFECRDRAEFDAGAAKYEAAGHPGYASFMRWLEGKCYPSIEAAAAEYELQTSIKVAL